MKDMFVLPLFPNKFLLPKDAPAVNRAVCNETVNVLFCSCYAGGSMIVKPWVNKTITTE
jgi:hypothetical protein